MIEKNRFGTEAKAKTDKEIPRPPPGPPPLEVIRAHPIEKKLCHGPPPTCLPIPPEKWLKPRLSVQS
jgi:hypothetical protein